MNISVKNPNPITLQDCVLGNTCYFYDPRMDEIIRGHFSHFEGNRKDKVNVFTTMTAAKYALVNMDAIFLDQQAAETALTDTKKALVAEYEAKMTCVEDILIFAYEHVIAHSPDMDELAREAYKNRVTELFPNVRL